MSVYICSDLHLGHKNITKYRSFVASCQDNTNFIVHDWKRVITKNDVVYCLGDAAFDDQGLDVLSWLPGRKILIKGNHDDLVSTAAQARVFEQIHGMIRYKGMWLTHCPIHPAEMRGRKANVHGHVHNKTITKGWGPFRKEDPRYINACVDVVYPRYGSIFMTLDQVRART